MSGRSVEVAPDVRLHVREWHGDGTPVLLVHGLASNSLLWDGVGARLAERGHAVAAVDQRGHGRSSKPDDGYDFETVTADLVGLIEALDFDRPVVAGQSWGGNVVIELGRRHPDFVSGVVAVDGGTIELATRFPSWEEAAKAMAPPKLMGTPFAQMEAWARRSHEGWPDGAVEAALANFEVREDGTVAPWLTFERHMAILRSLWEHRPSTIYGDVRVPVLLVPAGDAGKVADAEAALPQARVRAFPGAHHDVHLQHPVEVADAIADCIDDGFFS